MMKTIFPEAITGLPQADLPFQGAQAFLSQSEGHQILFMEFSEDLDLPEHSHAGQMGIVLEGRIDMVIGGVRHTYQKGDRYYIPDGVVHSGKIYAGYADITFFNQKDRYKVK
jgi:quercetin dioxygenase-like cupin family protein